MEKNSPIYNNKRFAQRTNNYGDYERDPNIPEPAARASNTLDFLALDLNKLLPPTKLYPSSVHNANSFRNNSIFKDNPKFKEEISKFVSYMSMLNDNITDGRSDNPKDNWLSKNKAPLDQYNEFTNWSQSERQKYSSRFNTMLGTKRGAILQKALVALKNAEIAAAKVSFPRDERVKEAKYMSDAPEGTVDTSGETSNQTPSSEKPRRNQPSSSQPSSSQSISRPSEEKPEVPKYNNDYFESIKAIQKADHLVYHAAKRALKLKGVKDIDSYYTQENYSTIAAEITKIADSAHMNNLNSKLKDLKDEALEILKTKTKSPVVETVAPPSSAPVRGNDQAGEMKINRQDGVTSLESPVQTEAGDKIRTLLEIFDDPDLPKDDLASRWKNTRLQIVELLKDPQIEPQEKIEFETKIKNIDLKYFLVFNPQGGQQTHSGKFFAYRTEDLAEQLVEVLNMQNVDVVTANDLVDRLKVMFYDSRGWQPDQELKTKLKIKINRYNFDNPDNRVKNF
jgi:hypothetical protein